MTIQIVRHGEVCELPANRVPVFKKDKAGKPVKGEDGELVVESVKEEPQENDFPSMERARQYLDKLLQGIMERAEQHPRHGDLIKSASKDGWDVIDTEAPPAPPPPPPAVDKGARPSSGITGSSLRGAELRAALAGTGAASGEEDDEDEDEDEDEGDEAKTPTEGSARRGSGQRPQGGGGSSRVPPRGGR
jgi:hypothetical protein